MHKSGGVARKSTGQAEVTYLGLLLVIAIGVTIGNLVSNWITAAVVAHQAEAALRKLNKDHAQQSDAARRQAEAQAAQAQAAVAAEQERVRSQRRMDANGVRLF